jgi:LuxR family maltose regulon positive regulatory protein
MSDTLLVTKFYAPPARPNLVARRRLTLRLDDLLCPGRKLALLCAPAGFGKTTLLADWLTTMRREIRDVCLEASVPAGDPKPVAPGLAWLSLDTADNDPTRFWSYLIAALDAVQPGVGAQMSAALAAPQAPPIEAVLTALINTLAATSASAPILLVLDDYHCIDSQAIHAGLTFLLDRLPTQLHLVLMSRVDPPLPLARWRARGELVELRAADLRFTADETTRFLSETMDLALPREAITALDRRIEGWIAGLHLSGLAMRDRADLAGFVAAFTENNRFVVDYLAEEVFARQPVHIQRFLLQTAILDRMCGALCDAVLGIGAWVMGDREETNSSNPQPLPPNPQAYSQLILEQLERNNLFTIPLDNQRYWYRYHHLFAEVLRERLLSGATTEVVAALHRRASVWFEQHGLVPEAVQHALASADWARAAEVIEQHGLTLIIRGQASTVLQWIHALPESIIVARPALVTIHAITLMFDQQLAAAELRLQVAEAGISADVTPLQAQLILGRVATVRSHIRRSVGDLPSAVRLAQQGLELLPETETIMRGVATLVVVRAYDVTGDVAAASEHLARQVIAGVRAAGNLVALVTSCTTLARLQVLQGRLRAAAATYAEAMQALPQEPALPSLLISYDIGWGDLLREWNDLPHAEEHLHRGVARLPDVLTVDAYDVLFGYTALARFQQARGDATGASETLRSFAVIARTRDFAPQLLARAAAIQAQFLLAQGDQPAAERWMETSHLDSEAVDLLYGREREYLTLARVLIAQRRFEAALNLLVQLLQNAEGNARIHSAIEIRILQALAHHAQGEQDAALTDLARALAFAAPEGYTRIFLDEGAPMATLLGQVANSASTVAAYASTLLAAFPDFGLPSVDFGLEARAVQNPQSNIHNALIEPLSERELEVLRLIAAGRSNQEIADALIIALTTVKKHINNIFGKLEVRSRTQALLRAREHNLL